MLSGCLGVVGHVSSGSNRKLDPINHILALYGCEGEIPREYNMPLPKPIPLVHPLEDTTLNPASFVLESLHINQLDLAQTLSARLAALQALLVSCSKALQVQNRPATDGELVRPKQWTVI